MSAFGAVVWQIRQLQQSFQLVAIGDRGFVAVVIGRND
jgi:hypothetical protein